MARIEEGVPGRQAIGQRQRRRVEEAARPRDEGAIAGGPGQARAGRGQQAPQRRRNALGRLGGEKTLIAAEQLVAAVAGERDGHVLACEL